MLVLAQATLNKHSSYPPQEVAEVKKAESDIYTAVAAVVLQCF